jgi:hypothetical protein
MFRRRTGPNRAEIGRLRHDHAEVGLGLLEQTHRGRGNSRTDGLQLMGIPIGYIYGDRLDWNDLPLLAACGLMPEHQRLQLEHCSNSGRCKRGKSCECDRL